MGALPAQPPHASLAILRRLYHQVWAYEIPAADVRRIHATAGSDVYGEIRPAASLRLFDYLKLGPQDVFFDLGSGAGKVVLHAALATSVGRAIGVEMSRTRHALAKSVVAAARKEGLDVGACRLRNANLMRTSLKGATVIYCCATAFSEAFLERMVKRIANLGPGIRFVTTTELDEDPRFELLDVLKLDMSWRRRAKIYVYRTRHPGPLH